MSLSSVVTQSYYGRTTNAVPHGPEARRASRDLHDFELADGRLIGFPKQSFEPDLAWLVRAKLQPVRGLKSDGEFSYAFDLGRRLARPGDRRAEPPSIGVASDVKKRSFGVSARLADR
jgi:hypothetical protein